MTPLAAPVTFNDEREDIKVLLDFILSFDIDEKICRPVTVDGRCAFDELADSREEERKKCRECVYRTLMEREHLK